MAESEERKPLKCTFKHLTRSYKKMFISIASFIIFAGVFLILFGAPMLAALYATTYQIFLWANPVMGPVKNVTLYHFVQVMTIGVGIVWSGYVVGVSAGVITAHIYLRLGILDAVNRMSAFMVEYIGDTYPGPIFEDPETMDVAWVKQTLYQNLVEIPLGVGYRITTALIYLVARFGIHTVICITFVIKAVEWANILGYMNDPSSPMPVLVIFAVMFVTSIIALTVEPAVACLATNLNVKLPDDL